MATEETQPETAVAPVQEPAPPTRPRRRRRRFALWLVVAAVVGYLTWLLVRRTEAPPRSATPPPVTVTSATARRSDVPVVLDAIGTVTPVYTASITSQVTGQVVAVHYEEGQAVRRGTPLVDIDPRTYRASLEQAQGILERDLHVLAQARMDLARYRTAWAKRAIAKQQLDDQEKLVLQTEGTVKNDRGAVQLAKVQLDYAHITSPIDGRVGLRLVDPGNLVTATSTTTLAVVTQLVPITVVFTVSQESLSDVWTQASHGPPLSVALFDRTKSKQLATGTLIAIDNQIDTTTGTVRLRARFANTDETLFPNQFVNTRLVIKVLRDVTTVPSSAIQRRETTAFVYVIQDGRATARSVTVGVTDGESTQVDGIEPGTVVANSGFERLQDGARVMIAQPPPALGVPNARSAIP